MYMAQKHLYKSTGFRFLTGVSAGIGDYLDTSHTSIRLLFILLTFASGFGLVLYIALSILLPTEQEVNDREDLLFYHTVTHGLQKDIDNDVQKISFRKELLTTQNIIALSIIFMGSVVFQFNVPPWGLIPDTLRYPSLIIAIGLAFIIKSIASRSSNNT